MFLYILIFKFLEIRGMKLTTHLRLVPRSNNGWSFTSTPSILLHGWCSVRGSTSF